MQRAQRKYYTKTVARLSEAKRRLGGACCHCTVSDPRLLQFDHIDPTTKRYNVTQMHHIDDETFWAEVAKCRLLCANCHQLVTHHGTTKNDVSAQALHHRARIHTAKERLGGVCAHCNIADFRLLQFDHLDPAKKVYNIAHMTSVHVDATFFEEIAKCQLLCANCHHLKTHYTNQQAAQMTLIYNPWE